MRTILHSDLNNFYASVEQIYNPEYRGVCLAVCGSIEDRHGIVLAKNELAKAKKIKTGMTLSEAYNLCPNLVTVEANFDRYVKYSNLVCNIYKKYTDLIEPFGIDEAWLDVTHSKIFGTGEEIAEKIRNEVRELGLTASVGVSFNKVFAKLGSDLKKPDATTVISYENFKDIVWKLDVSEMIMVGRSTQAKLKKYNIKTIGDIAKANVNFLKKVLGRWGEYLYNYAVGNDNSPVMADGERKTIKSVGNSMTSYRDLTSIDDIKIMFSVLSESVALRLIEYDIGRASTLSIMIRDDNLFSITRQGSLKTPSVVSDDFFKLAIKLFTDNFDWKRNVRCLGLSVSNFSLGNGQLSIFSDDVEYNKREKLEKTVYGLKKKFGSSAVTKAIGLKDKKITNENPKETHTIHPKGFQK